MKRKVNISLLIIVVALLSIPCTLYAAPKTIALKSDGVKQSQREAKANLKQIDLQKIQDPEVRKAVKEILRYLKLETKK